MRNGDGRVGPPPHTRQIEFQAHQEHVENHAHLRDHVEQRRNRLRKDIGSDVRRKVAEERGPEQNARDHLAHHRRLVNEAEQQTERARRRDHKHQRQQDMNEIVDVNLRKRIDTQPVRGGRSQRLSVRPDQEVAAGHHA